MNREEPGLAVRSQFLDTARATVTWRPLRLAYLVRLGNRDDLLDAITYASTEWGGYSHPILPIDRRGRIPPLDRQIAGMLRPDYLVNYAGVHHAVVTRIAESLGADPIFDRQASFGMHQIGLYPANELRARTLLVPRRPRDLREAVALGRLYPGQEPEWEQVGIQIQPATAPIDLLDGQLDVPSPIGTTRVRIETLEHSAWLGAPVVVDCWRPTFSRAVWVWNLRALAVPGWAGVSTRMIWLPPKALDDPEVGRRLREACVSSRTDPDLILNGPDEGALREVGLRLGFVESPGSRSSAHFDLGNRERDMAARPLRFRVNAHPAAWLFGDRRYGTASQVAATVTRPRTLLRVDSPIEFRPGTGGHLRMSIDGIEDLRWPRRWAVARLLEQNATYRDDAVGFVVSRASSYTFNLAVPEAAEVASAILGERGWQWSASDKGRYAQSLADAAGRHVTALASPEVLRFVQALGSLSNRKAEQLLRRLSSSEDDIDRLRAMEALLSPAPRWRLLSEVVTETGIPRNRLIPLTERLIESRLLRRALRLRCSACGLRSNIELDRADDIVACPGCGSQQVLGGPPGHEPEFAYAINSLLDRAIDQDCVSHVLAALWARQALQAVWTIPGALVIAVDGREREVDLLALSRESLIVGELQASSAAFRRSVVRSVATLARDLNADVLLLGSLDAWSEVAKAKATSWAGRGLRLVMVGAAELLAPETPKP